MDETQYILYEEYLANEAVKNLPNNSHSSMTIPSLYITSNQNIFHNFKTEAPSISKNILINLPSNSHYYQKSDNLHTLPISYEVKDAVLLQSDVVAPISANISNLENSNTLCQAEVKGIPSYDINLPPLTCSEILPNSTFLTNDPAASNSSTIEDTVQGSIGLYGKGNENFKNLESGYTSNSDLVPTESLQCKIPKLKKINPAGFVKLLQDDLLKFGTSMVKVIDEVGDETHHSLQITEKKESNKFNSMKIEEKFFISPLVHGFHDETEKAATLQCSQCDPRFSTIDAMVNHENIDGLGDLSCINVLNTQTNQLFANNNNEKNIADRTTDRFVRPESIHKPNKKRWKCFICHKEHSSLVGLEDHYNLHSAQDLSKVLIKFHDPLYRPSCGNPANITDEKASYKISCEEKKENQIFNIPLSIINNNLCDPSKILKQNKISDNSLNSRVRVVKPQPANEVLLKETIKLKIKPKITHNHKHNDNQAIKMEKNEEVLNFDKNEKKTCQTTNKEIEKKLNVLKTSSKILKSKKKSRSVGSGPGSRDPHQCSICKKVLSSRGNLAKHLIQHQSMKPWSCSSCGSSFNSKRDCDQHYMQRHTNIRPYVCQICSKGYVTSKTLDEHMNFHSTEKSFTCKLCGKTFLTSKCVRRHMHRHESLKNFSCGMCYKLFRVKEDLFAHIRKVHLTKKNHIDNKHKFSGSNYSLSSSQSKDLESCVQLQIRKKKSKKIENINKLSTSVPEVCQNDTMKEVAEFFIPTASAAVIFPELCELPSNIQIEKDVFYSSGQNYVPMSTLIPLSTQGVTNKYIFNTIPNKNRIDGDESTYVMLGLSEKDTGTMSSNHVLNCNSDLTVLYKPERSEVQHNKNDQRNIDQIFSSIPTSNPESLSHEHQLVVKNGGRISDELSHEEDKREMFEKNSILLNEQPMSKITHEQPIIDQICASDNSQNISLEIISQSLQLEFQNTQDVNNQNSIFNV